MMHRNNLVMFSTIDALQFNLLIINEYEIIKYMIPRDDSRGASDVILLYSTTRSVESIALCNSVACLTHHENALIEAIAEEMINPASLLLRPFKYRSVM